MRRLAAALALGACLTAFAEPAGAGVRAFRTSDGSEDPAFVRLGARTRVDRVVADGSQGAYLIGRIIVNGGARQIVHLRRDGTVDRAFRPSIRGGSVTEAAVHSGELALIGTFRSIDGHARSRVAVVDAHTGRPLPWKPRLPRSANLYGLGQVAFAGRTLVVGTDGGLLAWRRGAAQTTWARGFQFALIAPWRGAIWAVVTTPKRGARLASIDPASGRTRITGRNENHVSALRAVGGRLIALSRGSYWRVDHPNDARLASCGQASGGANGELVAVAVAGDARTLYVGGAPISLAVPGRVAGVTACPWSGRSTSFRSPSIGYSAHGPIVSGLALVGTHVLIFTRTF
jgi:hypothetical protein